MSGRMLVEYGSDLCSNEHHLMGSSENEAWKKFMSSGDLSPRFLRYRCRALPTELTSQLGAGHCTDSKLTSEVMSNWLLIYESHTRCMWIAVFFRPYFHYCSNIGYITAKITSIFISLFACHIITGMWFSHIYCQNTCSWTIFENGLAWYLDGWLQNCQISVRFF